MNFISLFEKSYVGLNHDACEIIQSFSSNPMILPAATVTPKLERKILVIDIAKRDSGKRAKKVFRAPQNSRIVLSSITARKIDIVSMI